MHDIAILVTDIVQQIRRDFHQEIIAILIDACINDTALDAVLQFGKGLSQHFDNQGTAGGIRIHQFLLRKVHGNVHLFGRPILGGRHDEFV